MPFLAFVSLLIAFFLSALPAHALRFYVDGKPEGNGDDRRSVQSAQNPATPFRTISHALRIAELIPEGRPHVIHIAAGTYSSSANGEIFPLVISQTGIFFETTGLVSFDAEGKSNFFQITVSDTSEFVIKGIDFSNGWAAKGGAVYCQACSLRVVDSRFFDNQATENGHVLYVQDGRVQFSNNVLRDNGSSGNLIPVIELHDTTFTDTTQRDEIRNNTFYRNPSPNILSSSTRTDINSNIFLDPEQPTILDSSATADPLLAYNLFWDAEILYISDAGDTIRIARTERDTSALAEAGISVPSFMLNTLEVKRLSAIRDTVSLEQLGVRVPSFVTSFPETLALVNLDYQYRIQVEGDSSQYAFNALTLPSGISSQQVDTAGVVSWRPTLNDTFRNEITVEITDPQGAVDTLSYYLGVFTAQSLPDTAGFIDVLDADGRVVGMAKEEATIEVPITVGFDYQFNIEIAGDRDGYAFNALTLPSGVSSQTVNENGLISWTPTLADTGSHQILIELFDPVGNLELLDYNIHVFTAETFPDTAAVPPVITVTEIPDTTGAIDALNALVPTFSSAASAAGNQYANPTFLDTTVNRFEPGTAAIDKGNPVIPLQDASGNPLSSEDGKRNNIGSLGGPTNAGAPAADTSFSELNITILPDSVVVEGQVFTYDPVLDPDGKIDLVDLIPGFGAPTMDPFRTFGKEPPITWTPTLADTGTYLIGTKVFTISREGRHYFPLRVKPFNEIPVVAGAPDTLAFEDSLYAYAIQASDPNADTLSYALVTGPEGMSVDAQTGLVQWTPSQDDVGSVQVEIRIDDGKGGSTLHPFTLTVANTNDVPVITSAPDSTAVEDSLYTYALVATDADLADTLSYAVVAGPDSMLVDSLGLVRWTPTQSDVGAQQITLQVQDQSGGAADQNFTLTVVQVDDTPRIASQPDTVAFEDSLYRYVVLAADEEDSVLTYSLETGPEGMQIDTTGVLEWTPAAADTGLQAVAVQVADLAGQIAAQGFDLRVLAVNDPPQITARSPADALVQTAPGEPSTFSVEVSDEEGDSLAFSWRVNDSLQAGASSSSLVHTPSLTQIDTLIVQVADGVDTTAFSWFVDARLIPRIAVAVDTVKFGSVAIGDTGRVVLTVANQGHAELNISNLQVGDLRFAAVFGTSLIPAGETTSLELRYLPLTRRARQSTITFATDDPDHPTVQIPVSGKGVVPTQVVLDLDPATGFQGLLESSVAPGEEIILALYAERALDLLSFEAQLVFDPAFLNFIGFVARSAEEANLLDQEGSTSSAVGIAADTLLQVTVTAPEGAEGISGDGLLGLVSLAVDSSFTPPNQTRIRLVQTLLQSSGQTARDTLFPEVEVVLNGRSLLVGDFDGDGVVDFTDFFLFADHFGAVDPLYDLNKSGGSVDFDDFFLFADHFGETAAKSLPQPVAAGPVPLRLGAAAAAPEQAEFEIYWQGGGSLRGYVVALEFDPQFLEFKEFKSHTNLSPLRWIAENRPGHLVVAAGLAADQPSFGGDDLGILVFARLSAEGTVLAPAGALSYTPDQVAALTPPPAVRLAPLPQTYVLYPPYPNPFNPETVLPFYLPEEAEVRLRVYDLLGRPVRTLAAEELVPGSHARTWKGRDEAGREVAAGLYLAELRAADFRQVRKLILLK